MTSQPGEDIRSDVRRTGLRGLSHSVTRPELRANRPASVEARATGARREARSRRPTTGCSTTTGACHVRASSPLANFANGSLDTVGELIRRDDVVLGLGTAGRALRDDLRRSYPTYLLTHWVRDPPGG